MPSKTIGTTSPACLSPCFAPGSAPEGTGMLSTQPCAEKYVAAERELELARQQALATESRIADAERSGTQALDKLHSLYCRIQAGK